MKIYNHTCRTSSNQGEIKETEVETALVRRSKIRRRERFLKGPIPFRDIAAASRLPGQALAIFLAIHHQTALTGKPSVTLPATLLLVLGITRSAKARSVRSLESAGLITAVRSKGRATRISLTRPT
jgi:DNA-binding MarR family transcriptional regulator